MGYFCLLCFISFLAVSSGYLQARDPYDSFGRFHVGLVVQDTSSLDATYESPIYTALDNANMTVSKIDTNTMGDSTYNSLALRWDTLNAVILCFGTGGASVDTSKAGGIGDVPVLVLEPSYFTTFGLPDTTASVATQDSFRVNGVFAFIDTSAIWSADDSVAFYTSTDDYYPIGAPSFDSNALLLTLDAADTVCVFDTLNGQARIAYSISDAAKWNNNQATGWTFFNRALGRLAGVNADSLFSIGMSVDAHKVPASADRPLKDRLELNGHRVYLVADDSTGNANPDPNNLWSNMNGFIYWNANNTTLRTTPISDSINALAISVTVSSLTKGLADSLDLSAVDLSSAGSQEDTVAIVNNSASLTSIYTNPDTVITGSVSSSSSILASLSSNAIKLGSYLPITSGTSLAIHKTNKWVYYGAMTSGVVSNGDPPDENWDLYDRVLGWMFEGLPTPPSDVTLTALSTDSVKIEWDDNYTGEDGYSIFLYDPDSMYFSHLGANITADSIDALWPPNSRVIADVAIVVGTDTVFSSSGPDTAWTFAAVPPVMFTKNVTDTSMQVYLNGYLLDERFDDEDYSADPVWTVQDGSAEIDTVKRHLRSTHATDSLVISTPFVDTSGDTLNDSEWLVSFQFSDSTSDDQAFSLYLSHKASILDTSGYQFSVTSSSGICGIVRLATDGSTADGAISAVVIDAQNIFKWHDLKVTREFTASPFDSTVEWTLYLDGDSLTAYTDTAPFYGIDFIGLRLDKYDVRADVIQVRGLRPNANHDSTEYAIQDSTSGKYVQADSTLGVSTVWQTWSAWGGSSGIQVHGLVPDSSYVFRSKARNEW